MNVEDAILRIPDFRFYITCFHKNSLDENSIIEIFEKNLDSGENIENSELRIINLAKFPFREYDQLAVLEIKMGSIDTSKEIKPVNVFHLSQNISKSTSQINKQELGLLFDNLNLHPYVFVIASAINNESKSNWSSDEIEKYKKSLGPWIEYYSGQFDDYSDELYDSRIINNLSNRMSEMHFVRSNSAFLYMPREDPRWTGWMDYMEIHFVNQIVLTRAILFCLMLLNQELDGVSLRIRSMGSGSVRLIEKELDFVESLQLLVSEISSKLNQERLMNRLQHSTKVIKECFRVFSIEQAEQLINEKVIKLQDLLKNEQAAAQTKLQNQQKRWILILNALIGYQVVFTIFDQVMEKLKFKEGDTTYDLIQYMIWGLVGVLLIVSVSGLGFVFLKSKLKGDKSELLQKEEN
ncbi:MAG: hypothetical protein ACXAD7_11155 [Candidatus Kariarchaeaceae archaeon]|jgi:hypothetical protein